MITTASGGTLESTVKSILQNKGFKIARFREWAKNPQTYGQELLLVHVPFKTIYHHEGNTEFLLKSVKYNLDVRIECKWQQVSGSVDEKLPYMYLNAIEAMPENHILVIIDGDGWKEGAIAWLKDAAKQKKYTNKSSAQKKLEVMNLMEFMTWANKLFS